MSKTYAQVEENGVVSRVVSAGGLPIAEIAPDMAAPVECGPEVMPGWLYDGDEFVQPTQPLPTPEQLTAALIAYAADKRWQVETGGVIVGGVPVMTDDRSKVMILGSRVQADHDPSFTVEWKAADGTFTRLAAPQIIAISDAVLAHIGASFAAEAEVVGAIEAGTITTEAEVDAFAWPS